MALPNNGTDRLESEKVRMAESNSTKEQQDEEQINAPLVFSCAKCRTIVGDSFSFLSSNEDMQTITLTAASNIQRSADVFNSKTGSDVGCTYFVFTCVSCQSPLGRYYLTTSRDLDELRQKFTFTVQAISSYQLGKAQHGQLPDCAAEEQDVTSNRENGGTSNDAGTEALAEEVLKIQTVVMNLLTRVAQLEEAAAANDKGNCNAGSKRSR